MEEEKDLFNFIRQFKYMCKTLYETEVNVEIVSTALKPKYNAEDIVKIIQIIFMNDGYIAESTKLNGLRTKSRKREIIVYRQCICLVLKDQGYSLTHIGNCLNQDHATVLHSIRSLKNLLETKEPLAVRVFNRIKDELKKEHNIDIYPPGNTKAEADS